MRFKSPLIPQLSLLGMQWAPAGEGCLGAGRERRVTVWGWHMGRMWPHLAGGLHPLPLPGPPGLQQHPPEPSMPWLCSPRMAYPLPPSEILTLASRPLPQPPSALSLHCLFSAAHLGSSLFSGLGNAVPPAWKALLLPLPTPFV